MDFGRKGDNKRAMNLMWKSGMSLKDAWAVVQGRKTKGRKGTSRKNCFGAYGDEPPPGYEFNPATRRFRKICEFGRDPLTGKCMRGPRAIPPTPPGYEYNVNTGKFRKICEYGRDPVTQKCLPAPRTMELKEGYEFNPATGRLRKVCDYGRNPTTGRCYGRPMDQSMLPPVGYEYGPNGKLRKVCLYGRDMVTGRCMGKPRPRRFEGVPDGYEINPDTGRYRKICPSSHYRNARGRCVPIKRASRYEDALEGIDTNPFNSGMAYDDVLLDSDPYAELDGLMESSGGDGGDGGDDYDPFAAFDFGALRRKSKSKSKPRSRTRRSCFGSCSACNAIN